MMTWQSYSRIVAVAAMLFAAAPADAGDVERAKRLFRQAEVQFGLGAFDQALELYLEAYAAKPLPGFHFNIGQCYRNLRQYEKALFHYKQYLARTESAENKADVLTLIAMTEEALARQQAQQPPTARLTPSQSGPGARAAPDVAPQQAAVEGKPDEGVRASSASRGVHRAYFWTGVGLAAATLAVGTIAGALALDKSSRFSDPSTPLGELPHLESDGTSMRTVANVAIGVGAGLAVATAVLALFTDFGARPNGTSVTVAPTAGGGATLLQGSF